MRFASDNWAGATPEGYKLCLYSFLLIGCMFSDLRERILPDEFTLGGTYVGVALSCLIALPDPRIVHLFLPMQWPEMFRNFVESAVSAGLPALLMWLVGEIYLRVRGREGLGFGDVKMVAMIGAFLGLQGALLTLIAGSLVGGVGGLLFIWLTGKDASTYQLPFGAFLGGAALAVRVFGESVMRWYLRVGP